jgi:hypothetical protein
MLNFQLIHGIWLRSQKHLNGFFMRPALLLFALLIRTSLMAQLTQTEVHLPEIIPPSPEAASLGKYAQIPISYYNGLPNISIPLYEIQVRDISIPISLSYHSSGIKVEEEASQVGLGWSLNAGGAITRSIKGNDDLMVHNGRTGYLYHTTLEWTDAYFDLNVYHDICGGQKDTQPDLFYFNIGGYSGKFVLQRKTSLSDPVRAIILSNENITATYDEGNEAWTLLAPDGTKYTFAAREYTEDWQNSGYGTPLARDPTRLPSISSWYLTRVDSPKGEIVTFYYESPINTSEMKSYLVDAVGDPDAEASCSPGLGIVNSGLTSSKNGYFTPFLESITFSNGRITFTHSNREDMKPYTNTNSNVTTLAPQKVDEIVIENNSKIIKKVKFQYGYFRENLNETAEWKYLNERLRLDEVYEYNGAGASLIKKGSHRFFYNQSSLPEKNSNSVDYWGYSNKSGSTTKIPAFVFEAKDGEYLKIEGANRRTNPDAVKAASLEKIVYPTGGFTEFNFESNTFNADLLNDDHGQFYDEIPDLPEKNLSFVLSNKPQVIHLEQAALVRFAMEVKCASLLCYTGNAPQCTESQANNGQNYIKIQRLDNGGAIIPLPRVPSYNNFDCALFPWRCDQLQVQPNGMYQTEQDPTYPSRMRYVLSPQPKYPCGISDVQEKFLQPGTYLITPNEVAPFSLTVAISYKQMAPITNVGANFIINGGGLRLARMRTHDGISIENDIVKKYDYNYRDDDGRTLSYGRLMSKPVHFYLKWENTRFWVNHPAAISFPVYATCINLIANSYSNAPMASSAQGNLVGYDKVTEIFGEHGENGRITYHYKNSPDVFVEPFMPNSPTDDCSYENGLLTKKEVFDWQNFKVQETETQYETGATIEVNAMMLTVLGSCDGGTSGTVSMYIPKQYTIKHKWVYPIIEIERTFDKRDPNNGRAITVQKTFSYEQPLHKYLTRVSTVSSEGQEMVTRTWYPLDVSNLPADQQAKVPEQFYNTANADYKHVFNQVIKQETTVEGNLVAGAFYGFRFDAPTKKILPDVAKSANVGGGYRDAITYSRADELGNPTEIRTKDNLVTSYLWGYNQTLPIAKIVNATYDQVVAQLNPGDLALLKGAGLTSNQIASKIGLLRTRLPDAQITIYAFEPHIGIAVVTDPDGKTVSYSYDELQRLVMIKDNDLYPVTGFKYNYKN